MKKILSFLFALLPLFLMGQNIKFEDYFENKALRIDYSHSGRYGMEYYTIEDYQISIPWAGTTTKLIDNTNFGAHKVEVYDSESNKIIYSRTYCSLFEEWTATKEGKNTCGYFEETVLIPYPKKESYIVFNSRDTLGNWQKIAKYEIEKDRIRIVKRDARVDFPLHTAGDPHKVLDVVIVPAGYTIADSAKMRKDMKMFSEFMFSKPPFSEFRNKMNIWGVEYYSEESGIAGLKDSKVNPNSYLGVSYNTFGSERYIMTEKVWNLHDLLVHVPYEQIVIMCNSNVYGGGGIYNFYSTSYVNPNNSFVLIHEFGHTFAGLGDEYSDHDIEIEKIKQTTESWHVNVTSLVDFSKKWKNMMDPSTPIPTPSTKEYENKVGVFEGASYQVKGLYRPYQNCLMRADKPFCPVCTKAIKDMIDLYTE